MRVAYAIWPVDEADGKKLCRTLQIPFAGKHIGLSTDRLEVSARNDEPLLDMTEDEIFELLSLRRAARARDVTRRVEKSGCLGATAR